MVGVPCTTQTLTSNHPHSDTGILQPEFSGLEVTKGPEVLSSRQAGSSQERDRFQHNGTGGEPTGVESSVAKTSQGTGVLLQRVSTSASPPYNLPPLEQEILRQSWEPNLLDNIISLVSVTGRTGRISAPETMRLSALLWTTYSRLKLSR